LEWKNRTTKSSRLSFLPQLVARPISGNGSGSSGVLPTSDANDATRGAAKVYDKTSKKQQERTLKTAVEVGAMLPTPRSADGGKNERTPEGQAAELERKGPAGCDLPSALFGAVHGKMSHGKRAGRMRLAPEMTEWMMGLPRGYTALTAYPKPPTAAKGSRRAGTPSSRK